MVSFYMPDANGVDSFIFIEDCGDVFSNNNFTIHSGEGFRDIFGNRSIFAIDHSVSKRLDRKESLQTSRKAS